MMRATFVLLLSLFVVCGMSLEATQQKVLIKVCSSTSTTSCNTNCSQYYALSDTCWNSYSQMPGSNDSYVFQCHPVPQGCLESRVYLGFGCNSSNPTRGTNPCHYCEGADQWGQKQSGYNACTNTTMTTFSCDTDTICGLCRPFVEAKIGQCTDLRIDGSFKESIFVAPTRRPCTMVKTMLYTNVGNCVDRYPQYSWNKGGSCNTFTNGANDNFDIALSCAAAGDVDASIPHISKLTDPRQMAALRRHVQGKGAAAAKKGF